MGSSTPTVNLLLLEGEPYHASPAFVTKSSETSSPRLGYSLDSGSPICCGSVLPRNLPDGADFSEDHRVPGYVDADLKIVVTNTMSNGTEVAERFPLLKNIDLDGLVGPVKTTSVGEKP